MWSVWVRAFPPPPPPVKYTLVWVVWKACKYAQHTVTPMRASTRKMIAFDWPKWWHLNWLPHFIFIFNYGWGDREITNWTRVCWMWEILVEAQIAGVEADAALITQHNNYSRREHVAPFCMNAVVWIEEKRGRVIPFVVGRRIWDHFVGSHMQDNPAKRKFNDNQPSKVAGSWQALIGHWTKESNHNIVKITTTLFVWWQFYSKLFVWGYKT